MELSGIRHCVLILLLIYQIRTLQAQCVGNFPSLEDIAVTSSAQPVVDTQLLFPSINFTCSTRVTGWIMAGEATGRNNQQFPEIQTWRLTNLFMEQYTRINTTAVNTTTVSMLVSSPNLYQYTYSTPIEVDAGDVLAIRIPPEDSTDIRPLFNTNSGGRTFDQYFFNPFIPSLEILPPAGAATDDMYFPLIAPMLEVSSSISQSSSTSTSTSTMSTSPVATNTLTFTTTLSMGPSSTASSSNLHMSLSTTSISSSSTTPHQPSLTIQTQSLSSVNTPSSHQPSVSNPAVISRTSIPADTRPPSATISRLTPPKPPSSSSVLPSVVGTSDELPISIVAGGVIAVLLFIIIIILGIVLLVMLVLFDKRKKGKAEISSPPPNGYGDEEVHYDSTSFTAIHRNIQLTKVPSKVPPHHSATLNGHGTANSNGHYPIPEYSDPVGVPNLIVYDDPADVVSPMSNGIYGSDPQYQFEQSRIHTGHYETAMSPTFNHAHPNYTSADPYSDPICHYEMEVPSKSNGAMGGANGGARTCIYESSEDASGYEQPVSSRNNTMVREYPPQSATAPINKYHVLSPTFHEYNVLDGSILVPSEEERDMMRNEENRIFDEQAYAKLGVIQKQKYENVELFQKDDLYWRPSTQPSLLYNQLSKKKFREILRSHVRIIKHLGSGQFGTVNEGVWSSGKTKTPVAVKLVSPNASVTEKVKLLQEGAIMGQFNHTNVVKLHGLVTVGEPVMIVIELMPNGDLRNHLKQVRQKLTQPSPPIDVPNQLLRFAKEVAEGMEYLSSKSFIHRDLAARNIFLTEDLTCKIGDFGMSRDLDDENYYVSHGGKIPVKWTAPEALQYKKYSPLSDVWSYGALMYEMWGMGHKPFEGFSNTQTIDLVQSGYRLPPPPGCPRSMYQLMIHCWHPSSSRRPSFSDIIQTLSKSPDDLLSWTNMDRTIHLEASTLGASLEAGQDLYIELQQTYIRSTIKIQ